MRKTVLGCTAMLVLCAVGCGGGPPQAEALEAIRSRAEARDTVYEKLTLPSTTTLGRNKSFIDALESAGFITVGDCTEGPAAQSEGWVRCDVSLTEKGAHDLEPYRLGEQYIRIPISHPEYTITRMRRDDDHLFFDYAHTAIPSPIREELGKHGYNRSLSCGEGTASYVLRDNEWRFEGLQKQRIIACK
jgi:hypothetical protein